jgi:hypothetical protein
MGTSPDDSGSMISRDAVRRHLLEVDRSVDDDEAIEREGTNGPQEATADRRRDHSGAHS